MARKKLARLLFAIAIILMPFSRVVKLTGDPRISWIDPTLYLSILVLALVWWEVKPSPGLALIPLAFISAGVGILLHKVDPGHHHPAWYVVIERPAQLTLGLILFWVCARYFSKDRSFAVKCVAVSVVSEMAIAIYMYAAMFHLVPVPSPVAAYLRSYLPRQMLLGALSGIPRMAGTYDEAPMFGLFMFCNLVILLLQLRLNKRGTKGNTFLWLAVACAALGSLASFSGQVILAGTVLLIGMTRGNLWKYRTVRYCIGLATLALVIFGAQELYAKKHYEETHQSGDVIGEGLGEREFHATYAMRILGQTPLALFLGIGPGRYGDYAASTGLFPSTVVPGTTAISWLLGYGLVGFCFIAAWLSGIGKRVLRSFGPLGMAAFAGLVLVDMFQSSWYWDPWFVGLAYLYASPYLQRSPPRPYPMGENKVNKRTLPDNAMNPDQA